MKLKTAAIVATSVILSACNTYGTDNTPKPTKLADFTPSVKVYQRWSAGTGEGVGKKYIKLPASYDDHKIFVAGSKGTVTALNANTGTRLWRVNTKLPITAGPSADNGLLFIGSADAKVEALSQADGHKVWEINVPSEVLAAPAASDGILIIKTIDGQLTAVSEKTGRLQWHYQEDVPSLILRGASAVVTTPKKAVAGFSNGKLIALDKNKGALLWQKTLAAPEGSNVIANMVDIDATPIIQKDIVYGATYQGNVAALNLSNGQIVWQHSVSTFAGIDADPTRVFVSEADGNVAAFNEKAGTLEWKQEGLLYRGTTGPALLGNTVVVADKEGYVHFLDKTTGRFVGRIRATHAPILATPLVVGNMAYVSTTNGYVVAFDISKA